MEAIKREREELFSAVMALGLSLIECGSDIQRVEDTVKRVSLGFGVSDVTVFAIPSYILLTLTFEDGESLTRIHRPRAPVATDLWRLERLNDLSRRVVAGELTPKALSQRIGEVKRKPGYPLWLQSLGAAFTGGGFAYFFGGSLLDALAAFLIGALMHTLMELLPRSLSALMRSSFFCFFGGALSILAVQVGFGHSAGAIIVGIIMELIPGIALGSSLRDLILGDTLSGFMRLGQALLTAFFMAFSIVASLMLFDGIGGAPAARPLAEQILPLLLGTFVGTLGFCFFFHVRPERILHALGGAMIAILAYIGFTALGLSPIAVNCLAFFFSGVYAECLAMLLKTPVPVFTTLSLIPLVPGSLLYYTMEAIVAGNTERFAEKGLATLEVAFGLALGFLATSFFGHLLRLLLQRRQRGKQKTAK